MSATIANLKKIDTPFYNDESKYASIKNLVYFLVTGTIDEERVRNAEIERKKMNAFFKKLSKKKFLFLPSYSNSKIMTLGIYINELLFDQNCVVVPGLGGFITRRVPSQINPVSNKITPPGKKVAFNQGLNINDGLLAKHISEKEQITYEEALEKINGLILELKKTLFETRTIHLENVGSFYMDFDEVTTFHPDVDLNVSKEDFGLVTLSALPVQRIKDEKQKHKIKTRVDQRTKSIEATRKRIAPKVAISIAACLVLGLLSFFFLPSMDKIHMASFSLNQIFDNNSQSTEVKETTIVKQLFPITETQVQTIQSAQAAQASDTTWSVLIKSFPSVSEARVCIDDFAAQKIEAKFSLRENNQTWVSIVKTGDKTKAQQCIDALKVSYTTAKMIGKKN
jgi:hypothetical protein